MARRHAPEMEGTGTDSFLDVVTNIVGILIVLVMVVGESASHLPVTRAVAPSVELTAARDEALQIEQGVHELQSKILVVNQELQLRGLERGELQTLVTAVERDLDAKQRALSAKASSQYVINRDLAVAQDALARMKAELDLAEHAPDPNTVQIKSYPTPLGATVDGKEVYLQLKNGRLTVVPVERLLSRWVTAVRKKMDPFGTPAELEGTVGPYDGFRVSYKLEKKPTPDGGISYAPIEAMFHAVSDDLGEPVENALREGSAFRRSLATMSPDMYTITLIAFPDSFEAYAKLRQSLCEMGYPVAGRPIPAGEAFGVSFDGSGTASIAQ